VDDACPLAALAALSLDENQLKKAEWYIGYPQVPLALSDHALRRAKELSPPQPPPDTTDFAGPGPVKTMLKRMNAQDFSAFAAIAHGGVGGIGAAISMIADIVRVEMDWQLFLMRPLSPPSAVAPSSRPAASEKRRRQPGSRSGIPAPAPSPVAAGETVIVPGARGQSDHHHNLRKQKRSMADVFEAETETETRRDPRRPPPEKRTKYSPSKGCGSHRPAPPRRSTPLEENGGSGQERAEPRRPPTPRPRRESTLVEAAPYCGLWARLGGRNVTSWSYNDHHDEDRGRAPQRRL